MVFELVQSGGSYTLNILVSFNGTNGGYLEAGLSADSGGNLFGTTYQGGANGNGTIFEIPAAVNATWQRRLPVGHSRIVAVQPFGRACYRCGRQSLPGITVSWSATAAAVVSGGHQHHRWQRPGTITATLARARHRYLPGHRCRFARYIQ